MLDRIAPLLPTNVLIALMADSEFRNVKLFEYACARNWDYALGHKGDTLIFRDDTKTWQLTNDNYISRLATIRFPGIAPCS